MSPVRTLLFALTAAFAPALSAADAAPAAPAYEDGQFLGSVWAGHPVTFGFLTERGHQFVAYYDAERRITVLGRELDSPDWQRVQPEGVDLPGKGRASNVTNWDSHNFLVLALDAEGHVHLSGNMHNDALVYYRSTKPFDVTTLERLDRMTGERENNATYPVFFKDADGNLLFRYRDGSSGNGSDIYNRYDAKTKTWSNLLSTPLLDGEGQRNAYASSPVLGPDGYFHLVWVWRESPDCATNHSLSYARSRDLLTWEAADGTPIPLPITLAKGDVVDDSPQRGGLINMTFNIGFDKDKKPVVTYHKYDELGKSQVYAARPLSAGGDWMQNKISDWKFRWQFSGGGSIAAEVLVGPATLKADGNLAVDYITTREPGTGRFLINPHTFETVETQGAPAPVLPESLQAVRSTTPEIEVQTQVTTGETSRWVLRWETLPRNRDRPREVIPPATELRLYNLPPADTSTAARIGS